MKKLILSIVCVCIINMAWATDEAYQKAMQQQVQALNQAHSQDALQTVANAFERIASRETDQWLPVYYAGLAYIWMSTYATSPSDKDATLDKARTFVDKAVSLAPNESESVLLDGYWHMIKLSVDAASRGAELTPKVMQLYGKATQLNPENPRAYLLMGQMEYGMAQFFGNSSEKACAMLRKSAALFENTSVPDGISPDWGKSEAAESAGSCK